MKKFAIAAAMSCALFLGGGVAHASPVDDAINSYSGIPGLVDYLNLARDNGLFSYGYGAEAVHLGAQFAIAYCQMTPEQQADENSQAADIDPGLAAILVPALHDFCAN